MTDALTKRTPETSAVSPALVAQTASNAKRPLAANTVKAYEHDWHRFSVWCRAHRYESLPAEDLTICLYLTALARGYSIKMRDGRIYKYPPLKWSSLARASVSIRVHHKDNGHDAPESQAIKNVLRNIAVQIGKAPTPKNAIRIDELRAMVQKIPPTLFGLRERAILLLGFAIAARREDLANLNVEDLEFVRQGLIVHIRRGKSDQEGYGRDVAVFRGDRELCPIRAVQAWIEQANLTEGALFRTVMQEVVGDRVADSVIARTVKRAAESIGLDPDKYAGHSLRSGFCSSTMAPLNEIQRVTGHRSVTHLLKYVQRRDLFERGAGDGLMGRPAPEDDGVRVEEQSADEGREVLTQLNEEREAVHRSEGREAGGEATEGQRNRIDDRGRRGRDTNAIDEGREEVGLIEGRESVELVDHEINALAMNDAFYRNPADDKPLRRVRR